MMSDKKFNELLEHAAMVAHETLNLNAKLSKAFIERYGCTYSDADEDILIDILDYGHLEPITAAMF